MTKVKQEKKFHGSLDFVLMREKLLQFLLYVSVLKVLSKAITQLKKTFAKICENHINEVTVAITLNLYNCSHVY